MNHEDISYAHEKIREAQVQTPYGEALPMPWVMLQEALIEVGKLRGFIRRHRYQIKGPTEAVQRSIDELLGIETEQTEGKG